MIRPPIKPWTPPIPFDRIAENVKRATERQTANQSSAGGSQARIPSFESVFQEMLRHYMPETVEFTPLSEKELSDTIRNWLRPAYEQAIQNRREQTGRINAELDADAWSRGMGQSTYLSDVKSRQLRDEARDVDTIESNYSSTLAGHLYDAIKEQQKTKLEVDQILRRTRRQQGKHRSRGERFDGKQASERAGERPENELQRDCQRRRADDPVRARKTV